MAYAWYKYRTMWSYGHAAWEYTYMEPKRRKDFIEQIHGEHNWSEHYRGVEVKKIQRPPDEILRQKIDQKVSQLKYVQDDLHWLRDEWQKVLNRSD